MNVDKPPSSLSLSRKTCFCIPKDPIRVLPQEVLFYSMSCTLQMLNYSTQKNLIERKQCKKTRTTKRSLDLFDYESFQLIISLFGFPIRHVDVNGRCQAHFTLSKGKKREWASGFKKHILYIISYKLPGYWCKKYYQMELSLSFKGSMVVLAFPQCPLGQAHFISCM